MIAVVPVEVRADRARPGVGLAVLAPGPVRRAGEVVLGAVRVDREHDPDLAGVDDAGDPAVRAVARGQPAQQREVLLERQVLAGVMQRIEHDLRLGLVGGDVVRDLGDPQVAMLVALADRADGHDVGVGGLSGLDLGDHLRRTCGSGRPSPGSRRLPRPAQPSPTGPRRGAGRGPGAALGRVAGGVRASVHDGRSSRPCATPRWGYTRTGTAGPGTPGGFPES